VGLESNIATVLITLLAVRVAPLSEPVLVTVNEGSSVEAVLHGVSAYPSSVNYSITVPPAHGTLVLLNANNGTFEYTPDYLFYGSDFAAYTLTDSNGNTTLRSSISAISITVNQVPYAPVASNFNITATAGVNYLGQWVATDVDVGDVLTGHALPGSVGTVTNEPGPLAFAYLYPYSTTNATDKVDFYVSDSNNLNSSVATMYVTILASTVPTSATAADGGDNQSGSSIAGAAVGAIVGLIIVVAILAYAFYQYQQRRAVSDFEKETLMATKNMAMNNPLYIGTASEGLNPLYVDPGENVERIWERQTTLRRHNSTGTTEDLYRDGPTMRPPPSYNSAARSVTHETFANPLFNGMNE